MPKFVTALFADQESAERAMEALRGKGFETPDMQHVDRDRMERERFFERLFLDENGDGDARAPRVMGIARTDSERLTELLEQGRSLVIVLADDGRVEDVQQIFARQGALDWQQEVGSPEEPAQQELTPKWFRVVEIEEDDLSRGARAHAVHVRPRKGIHHVGSDELPGAHSWRNFEHLKTDFQVHYRENFAGSKRSFDDYAVGYRYGMALAENRAFQGRKWSEVQEHARRGWIDHGDEPWEEFEEAVHFGWRMARLAQRREDRWRDEGRWSH